MSETEKSQTYKAIIVSDDLYPESKQKIESLGVKIYSSYCNTNVLKPLWRHVDMQIVEVGDIYFCAPESYSYYKNILEKYDLKLVKGNTELSSNYPCDIAYNITVTERFAIHNFKYTDKSLKEKLSCRECIDVSQGYSKCSLCVVSDEKFITSDRGLFCAMSNIGCDVLSITQGFVELPGFDYGFFGGASLKLGKNILALNGNINTHPDAEQIRMFCKSAGVELISLSERPLMDIGSAVIIK